MMDFLPIFYDLKGQRCLIVGGGDIALRKADLLMRAGAILRVVSLDLCDALEELIKKIMVNTIKWHIAPSI